MATKRKPKPKLPDKLSELLTLAINDCKVVAKDKRYHLNMHIWHQPLPGDKAHEDTCEVCMAGAVMANTLSVPITRTQEPCDHDIKTQNKLLAINDMRTGCFGSALDDSLWIGLGDAQRHALREASDIVIVEFNRDSGMAPLSVYLKAAKVLAKAGL